jgi:hypothetical protein
MPWVGSTPTATLSPAWRCMIRALIRGPQIVVATKRDGLHSMFCIILFVQCFQSRSSEPELEILMRFFSPGLEILNPSALRSNVPVSGYKPPSGTHIRIPNHSKYFIAEFLSL